MEENKSLGSVINEIDSIKDYNEYLGYRVLPHTTGLDNYKGIDDVHEFMMDSIILSSIDIALIRKGTNIISSLDEIVNISSKHEYVNMCDNFIETYTATLAGFKWDLCDNNHHNLYNHDTLIKFLDINNIAYFTQTVRNNDKNRIDRNIIINIGENNILELKESLSSDNIFKLVDIDLKLINYDNHLKSQSNNEYFSEIEIHEGVPF